LKISWGNWNYYALSWTICRVASNVAARVTSLDHSQYITQSRGSSQSIRHSQSHWDTTATKLKIIYRGERKYILERRTRNPALPTYYVDYWCEWTNKKHVSPRKLMGWINFNRLYKTWTDKGKCQITNIKLCFNHNFIF
jgi:hypothetical protein